MEIRKFGYEDTDKNIKVEIYGLEFEIKNIDKDKIEELKNIEKTETTLEVEIELILGEGAIEKINNKRVQDGYEKMDLQMELGLLGFVFDTYAESLTEKSVGSLQRTLNNIENKVNDFNNFTNRYQRRNYNRRKRY